MALRRTNDVRPTSLIAIVCGIILVIGMAMTFTSFLPRIAEEYSPFGIEVIPLAFFVARLIVIGAGGLMYLRGPKEKKLGSIYDEI